jgi:hypothetical protein
MYHPDGTKYSSNEFNGGVIFSGNKTTGAVTGGATELYYAKSGFPEDAVIKLEWHSIPGGMYYGNPWVDVVKKYFPDPTNPYYTMQNVKYRTQTQYYVDDVTPSCTIGIIQGGILKYAKP